MPGYIEGLIALFSRKKPEPEQKKDVEDPIIYHISEQKLKSLVAHFDDEMKVMRTQIARIEGQYGKQIGELNTQLRESQAAHEEKDAALEESAAKIAELEDKALRLQRAKEAMPGVLGQLGFTDAQVSTMASHWAAAEPSIDALLEEHLPGVPITAQSLMTMAPVILGLLKNYGMEPKKKEETTPKVQEGATF